MAIHENLTRIPKQQLREHAVVKHHDGKLSIAETAITELGANNGFDVTCTKDGRIFDSKYFHAHQAVFFFTTGDLTEEGTDIFTRCVTGVWC